MSSRDFGSILSQFRVEAAVTYDEFFTIQSMLTLTGATGATFVVANGLQKAFNFNPRWSIAQAISLFGVLTTGKGAADVFVEVRPLR